MKTHACKTQSCRPRFYYQIAFFGIGLALALVGTTHAAPTDDPICKIVLDAMTKLGQTPHHQYATMTGAMAGGQVRETESITAGGLIYTKRHGTWATSPITAKAMAEQEQKNMRNKTYRCEYERDESLDGEATAVYTAHSEDENGPSDAEIWISKSRGLPLREMLDLNAGESHMSVRFDYANVKAPIVK